MSDEIDTGTESEYDPYATMEYRCILLKNGEMIIAGIPKDDIEFRTHQCIEVYHPVLLIRGHVQEEDGSVYESFQMREWFPMADVDFFEIESSEIMTMATLKPKHEEKYFSTLDALHIEKLREVLAEEENLTAEEREDIKDQIGEEGLVPDHWIPNYKH